MYVLTFKTQTNLHALTRGPRTFPVDVPHGLSVRRHVPPLIGNFNCVLSKR
jgi:hypothetical protein